MTDIIQRAQSLLEEATPGPWSLDDSFDPGYPALHGAPQEENGIIRTPILSYDISDDFDPGDADLIAAAPVLAQALAEETYEYSVQIKDHTGEWETATNSESHLEEWWESKKHAEWAMVEEQEFGEHCRIVRRRVSTPEVINE